MHIIKQTDCTLGRVDQLFNDLFGTSIPSLDPDLYEVDGGLEFSMAVPGFSKDEIDIGISDGRLEIKAEKSEKDREHRRYVGRRSVYRKIYLPRGVQAEMIEASCQDGILTLKIPVESKAAPVKVLVK